MFLTLLTALVLVVTVGGAIAIGLVYRSEARPGVVALLYHRVRDDTAFDALVGAERNFSVPLSRFTEQLQWLQQQGYQFLTLDDVYEVATGRKVAPARSVCITFDDGSSSVMSHAHDVLQRQGVASAVFVTADPAAWVFEDQPRLTDAEIASLSQAGVHIGAHGVTHHGLNHMPDAELSDELAASRTTLEHITGQPIVDMALPLNFYDERVLAAAKRHGYRMVFTANPGRIRAGDRLLELRRIAVEGSMTISEFAHNLTARSLTSRRIVAYLKRVPPRMLGETRWMPIRRTLFESPLGPWLTFRYLKLALVALVALWLGLLVALIAR